MISFNTLLFPDTLICKDRLYPLFLFFSPIHYLQPVETDPEHNQQADRDSFMERGLCQGHTPVPLEKNRQRFVHLIKEIRERRDDYSAQLASLAIAGMSASTSPRGGESKREIISALLGSQSPGRSFSDEAVELWQARLVLAIAEILEKDEEDLQQKLQLLDNQEMKMFRSLQGEGSDGENPFAELEQIKSRLETRKPQAEKNRFKAWLQLMKHFQTTENLFWLASSQDSADQVFTRFEQKTSGSAIPLLSLQFPAHISVSQPYLIKQIETFHQQAKRIHDSISHELEHLAQSTDYDPGATELLLPGSTDWSESWNLLIEDHFPASSHGRSKVTIYILPDNQVPDLFSLKPTKSAVSAFKHGLLGVLKD